MADQAQNSTPANSRQPWYRLHLSTWVVLLLGIVVATLHLVSGELSWYPWEHSPIAERSVEHGWPLTFLWRIPKRALLSEDSLGRTIWVLNKSVERFQILSLGFDLLVVGFAVGAVTAVWEWRERRYRLFQFSLRTAFVVVTLTAVGLGWWRHERDNDDELQAALSRVAPATASRVPRFPLWLRTWIGDDRLIQLGITKLSPSQWVTWSGSRASEVAYLVRRFPDDIVISVDHAESYGDLDALCRLTSLWQLTLDGPSQQLIGRLGGFPDLRCLWLHTSLKSLPLSDATVATIARKPRLRLLYLDDAREVGDSGFAALANSSTLQTLILWRPCLTRQRVANLARVQNLQELSIIGARISDELLLPLAQNNSIEVLRISDSLITDAGLQIVTSIRNLKRLDLLNCAVTDAAVASIKKSRPELTINCDSEKPDLADLKTNFDEIAVGITTRLVIQGWKIRDAHVTGIGKLASIESLALTAAQLTDKSLARCAALTNLKELEIQSSNISGRGLWHVINLPNLRTLTLDERQIDDEAIAALAALPALKNVWIKRNRDVADGEKREEKLRVALPESKGYKLHFDKFRSSDGPWE